MKIIRRSKSLSRGKAKSPVKLNFSPAKVNVDAPTTSSTFYTSQSGLIEDDTDSETMADVSLTKPRVTSSCTSCQRLKKKIKPLQKTISWYKKKKANLSRRVRNLQAESKCNKSSVVSSPSSDSHVMATEIGMNTDSDGDEDEENSDDEALMDYSSVEESSQSTVQTEEEETRNTLK